VSLSILKKQDINEFINHLLPSYRVCGPVQKNGGYTFETINEPDELRLEYPTTILPPKKFILPVTETLFEFEDARTGKMSPPEQEAPILLLGVHACDLHAFQLLDSVFSTGHVDMNYVNRRRRTMIASIECLAPCDGHSFCKSMGTLSADEGYDLHLVDLGEVYAVDVMTEAGQELIKNAQVLPATATDIERLNAVLTEKWPRFPYRLDFDITDLPSLLNMSMKSPLWAELGERCLGCAACTNVCPNCVCFDVRDELDLNLTSGRRIRHWDSCQLDEFATVAGGHDFRKKRALRQRHRFMRKGRYLLEAHKSLGCVGCGRCARACLVDISPVSVFNELYRRKELGGQA
jgi:sulfhydrogenase subunit beta (sulfur reductase)